MVTGPNVLLWYDQTQGYHYGTGLKKKRIKAKNKWSIQKIFKKKHLSEHFFFTFSKVNTGVMVGMNKTLF